MKKRTIALMCTVLFIFSLLTGCGSSQTSSANSATNNTTDADNSSETIVLKFAGTNAKDQPVSIHMQNIIDTVYEQTNGHVQIKPYYANALGDATLVFQGVMDGSVDMMCGFISPEYDALFNVSCIPYLATSWDDLKLQLKEDSNFTKYNSEACDNCNMVYLGMHVDGFCGVSSTKEPENSKDPTKSKGVTIRCVSIESARIILEAQGYSAIGLPWDDTYTSIQTGICDGSSGQTANGAYQNFRDLMKYYIPYNMSIDPMTYVINKDSFAKLSAEEQQILKDAVYAESMAALEEGPALEEAALEKMESDGIEVIRLNEDEINTVADAVRQELMPVMAEEMGQDIIDDLLSDLEQ